MKFTVLFLGLVTLLLIGLNKSCWLIGVWGTCLWLLLNAIALFQIFEMVKAGGEPNRKKIFAMCLVKYPLLYLAGLGFLLLPWTELEGVLISFTLYLGTTGLLWFRMKQHITQ